MEHALDAEDLAKADGLLQRLDPRIKVIGIFTLIIAAAMAHKLWVIGAVFAIALSLAASSRVSAAALGQAGVDSRAAFHRHHRPARAFRNSRPRGLAPSRAWLAADGARTDERELSGDPG